MNDQRPNGGKADRPDLRAREEEVRRLLRDQPAPEPAGPFREQLRRSFMEGRVPPPETSWPTPARLAGRWWRYRPWHPLRLAAAFGVALILAFLVTGRLNRGPAWRVVEFQEGAKLVVDGAIVDVRDVMRRAHPGSLLQLPDTSEVTLASPGNVVLQILPGTEMTMPAPPARWFGRTANASVASGELRVTTDRTFRGARLVIRTPEVEVELAGTTVAVLRPPFGTCVCVLEGTVQVELLAEVRAKAAASGDSVPAGPEAVGPGRRFTYHWEDGSIDRGEMLLIEKLELAALRSRRVVH